MFKVLLLWADLVGTAVRPHEWHNGPRRWWWQKPLCSLCGLRHRGPRRGRL